MAYLVGKTIASVIVTSSALREVNRLLGSQWLRVRLSRLSDWRSIGRFALSTNLNGTVNLLARDNIPLYIGYFRSQEEVGYFRLAVSILNLVMLPIEPFIWPTYAEITRTVAQRQWDATRKLLKQVSSIAGAWTLAAGGGLVALGWWLIPLIYGADSAPAYPAFIILLFGYGCANILNWNRPLLLALGKPTYPLLVAAVVGVVEVALIFLLVPQSNYLMGAAIFSGYLIVSIGWNVIHGVALIKRKEAAS
jgi:O-antigen/teichoic acid export membrane protein